MYCEWLIFLQLDAENTALTQASRCMPTLPTSDDKSSANESELDTSMLVDKILHLKDLLRTANDKAEKPANLTGEEFLSFCDAENCN